MAAAVGIIILTGPEMADNAIVLCCSVLMMIMMKPMMLVRILETKKSLFFLKSMSGLLAATATLETKSQRRDQL